MGKNQKSELGRALVKQHNQMIQQSKEKGHLHNKKKVLESFTEITDIDAIIEQVDYPLSLFATDYPSSNRPINL